MRKYLFTMAWLLLTITLLRAGDGQTWEKKNTVRPDAGDADPGVAAIVTHMERAQAANRALSFSYTVTRDYKVYGKQADKTKAHVIAEVNYIPPDSKRYAIRQADGSALGVRLIRKVLDKESQLAKDSSLTYIDRENYDFRFSRAEEVSGRRCYVLELIPKRKIDNLLQGTIVVDAESYLIQRVEGQPAASPSWWLRDLTVTIHYGEVSGMWLQTASEVAVTVRLLGRHTLTMVARDAVYTLANGPPPPAGR